MDKLLEIKFFLNWDVESLCEYNDYASLFWSDKQNYVMASYIYILR